MTSVKIIKIVPVLVATIILLSSCHKIVEDLNVDPNNPTNASLQLLLTGAQLENFTIHESSPSRIAGIWSGYFSGNDRQYKDLQNYNASGALFSAIWQSVYYGVIAQERLIEEKSRATNNRIVAGIAKVVKAHAAGSAASYWGDVPFKEAGDITNFPQPAFDPQIEVFSQLQSLLDDAIADLNSNIGTSPGTADLHFSGRTAAWVEVAHTLKSRYYLQTREYVKAYDEAQAGIRTVANSLVAPHGTTINGNENFTFAFQRVRAGDLTAQGALITSLLNSADSSYRGNQKTDETARLNYYFTFASEPNGAKSKFLPNILTPGTSSALKGFFAQNASFPLVTYEENMLTAAEAGSRILGFEAGLKALNIYRNYLDAGNGLDPTYRNLAYNYDPLEEVDFLPGGLLNKDLLSKEEALLREILLERYITFYAQELGFHDLRRTRGEAMAVKLKPYQGNVLPERFIYAQDEINSNTKLPWPVPGLFVPTSVNKK